MLAYLLTPLSAVAAVSLYACHSPQLAELPPVAQSALTRQRLRRIIILGANRQADNRSNSKFMRSRGQVNGFVVKQWECFLVFSCC
jgi:hypothetical protein